MHIYEGVKIIKYYRYYQMMLRVNNFFIQTKSREMLLVA
jgi:hypothetical protein